MLDFNLPSRTHKNDFQMLDFNLPRWIPTSSSFLEYYQWKWAQKRLLIMLEKLAVVNMVFCRFQTQKQHNTQNTDYITLQLRAFRIQKTKDTFWELFVDVLTADRTFCNFLKFMRH